MAILRVKVGPYRGKVFDIHEDTLVIGRDVPEGVQVLDQGISRRHAEIFRIGEMYFIRDLESRNGTFVNEKGVTEEILRVGDQIRVGNSVLVFEDRLAHLKDSSRILSDEAPPATGGSEPPLGSTIHLTLTSVTGKKPGPAPGQTIESRHLSTLFKMAAITSEEKDLSLLLGRTAELIGQTFVADHIFILWQRDEIDGTFEILGRHDREGEEGGAGCVSRGIVRDCLKFGRAVLTSDASLDSQFNTMATVVMKQLRSVMCVPISLLGTPRGVLYVYSRKQEAFSSDDLELASVIGIELGTTIGLLKSLRSADTFFRNSIKAIVSAIEMRNVETRGKSERVASYCLSIAKELGVDTHNVRNAWLAGMLHDLGSIPLTDKEREQELTLETRKNHYAREIFKQVPTLEAVLPAIEGQNERWDGSGSPEGRKGSDIPLLARVLGLALELDRSLFHGSAGGEEMTIKDALLKLKETADRQFDRETLNALFRAYRNGKLFGKDEEFFEAPLN